MSWPERDDGWEDALVASTRKLLADMAERFGLLCEWDEATPAEVACKFPRQPGLDFELTFWLSGDEFGCGGDGWYANIFPADGEQKWAMIARLVEGLITGEARIALYRPLGRAKPFWTEVQLRRDGRWKSVSTGAGCAFPPIIRPTFLRNGHPPQSGFVRPAVGTIALLILLAAGLHLLFR